MLVCTYGPSIKYVTLLLANIDSSPPVTLCHTFRDPPKKYVAHLGPPFLVGLVQETSTKTPCKNSLSIVHGLFVQGVSQRVFCLEGFVRGDFCPFPFCQNTSITAES